MKTSRLLPLLAILLICIGADAATITATITITNVPGVGSNWTINGNTRIWTNSSGTPPNAWINTGASVGAAATNLYNSIVRYQYTSPILTVGRSSTNIITLKGPSITVTTNNYFSLSYSTNVGTNLNIVQVPFENVDGNTNRTNNAHWLIDALNTYPNTNRFNTNAHALGNFLTKGPSTQQVVVAPVQFNGVLRSAIEFKGTNGFTSAFTNINPVTSNLVNYGNAIRSEGSGGNSFQAGSNAQSLGYQSLAIGNQSIATNTYAIAVGISATATNTSATALGNAAKANGVQATAVGGGSTSAQGDGATAIGGNASAYTQATALGSDASASGTNSIAIGPDAQTAVSSFGGIAIGTTATTDGAYALALGVGANANYSNSAAIGPPDDQYTAVATTTTNQTVIGTSRIRVSIPGQLLISGTVSNTTFAGTNIAGGSWSFPRANISSLANGNNIAVPIGTNLNIRFAGSVSASPTICGMIGGATSGGTDGQIITIHNDIGYSCIFAQNTVDPVPANRIETFDGADITVQNNGEITFKWTSSDSRWHIITYYPQVAVSTNAAIASVWTNGMPVGSGLTNIDFVAGVTGYVSGATVKLGVSSVGGSGVDGSANSNLSYTIGLANTNYTLTASNNLIASVITTATNKVDKLNGVATNLTVYTGSPGLTVIQLPGAGTNGFQYLNTNGATTVFVTSNDVFVASNSLVRGKFTNAAPAHLQGSVTVSGNQTNSGSLDVTGNITTSANFVSGNWPGNKAIVSDGNTLIESATVSDVELGYLDGVTSAIQTQLDTKVSTNHNTALGTNFISGVADIGTPGANDLLPILDTATATRKYVKVSSIGGSSGPSTNAPPYTIAINSGLGSTNILIDMLALGPTNTVRATLTANAGVMFTNVIDGKSVTLETIQDSTGNRTITTNLTWGFNFRAGRNVTGFYTTTNANIKDLHRFYGSGTNALLVGQLDGFAL